jgi:hypothetical protein
MTERPNRVARVVKEAIIKSVASDVQSGIHDNTTIPEERLSQGRKTMKPES